MHPVIVIVVAWSKSDRTPTPLAILRTRLSGLHEPLNEPVGMFFAKMLILRRSGGSQFFKNFSLGFYIIYDMDFNYQRKGSAGND